jgi:hypothetical protein
MITAISRLQLLLPPPVPFSLSFLRIRPLFFLQMFQRRNTTRRPPIQLTLYTVTRQTPTDHGKEQVEGEQGGDACPACTASGGRSVTFAYLESLDLCWFFSYGGVSRRLVLLLSCCTRADEADRTCSHIPTRLLHPTPPKPPQMNMTLKPPARPQTQHTPPHRPRAHTLAVLYLASFGFPPPSFLFVFVFVRG